ncbi:hypothetical protein BDV29DRAFT_181006 [Aspergillus leporis]|uniref:Uncharacterized protein n=1 Tax=Aspergillus leporis TaxID=41062 RepID=A0A5N5WRN3_9EURO|nr:hypothetical protein BDV29DRAFT_181006 [Aspergillus leporis]
MISCSLLPPRFLCLLIDSSAAPLAVGWDGAHGLMVSVGRRPRAGSLLFLHLLLSLLHLFRFGVVDRFSIAPLLGILCCSPDVFCLV